MTRLRVYCVALQIVVKVKNAKSRLTNLQGSGVPPSWDGAVFTSNIINDVVIRKIKADRPDSSAFQEIIFPIVVILPQSRERFVIA